MDGRFDELLLGMAQKHRGIDDVLNTLMCFMERRTDLFHVKEGEDDKSGFKDGEAEKMLRKQFAHFQERYLRRAQPHLIAPPRGSRAALSTASPTQGSDPTASSSSSSAGYPTNQTKPKIPDGVNASPLEGGDPGLWEREQKKAGRMVWNQTPQELTVEIDIEKCAASDLKVTLAPRSVCVKRQGEVVVEGKLFDQISVEDSTWHVEGGKQVVLSLEKKKPAFWDGFFASP
eukprot:TRINITY_DN22063_c0_g1_i1.p1 TRINITY_DN22063_c0_g1~~TRINITY_DN22063_c0_g1_i1.p1  ORF type:complete len:246 (-),score=42.40 TRINITY_DN22063_c0_g1_i1:106-798(-)